MDEIKLVIYGEPVAQGRPRFARVGKYVHTYDPQKSKNYKQLVRFWVTQQLKKIEGFKPLEKAENIYNWIIDNLERLDIGDDLGNGVTFTNDTG